MRMYPGEIIVNKKDQGPWKILISEIHKKYIWGRRHEPNEKVV